MKAINLTKRAIMLMVVATATMMATLCGCGTKDDPDGDPIDGTWTATYSGVTFTLDINASAGTYLFSANSGESESGAYDPKTGNMTSSDGESFYKVKYNKSDDTLTLTDDDGIKVVFDRVGGKKEENNNGGNTKLNSFEQKLVGGWTDSKITIGGWYTVSSTASVIIERFTESSMYCSITVFRPDKTGYNALVTGGGYLYNTWNWSADAQKVYYSKTVGTSTLSSGKYDKKSFSDSWHLYKVRTYEGKLQYVQKPSFIESSEQYKWTIDQYIANGNPTWETKIDEAN